MKSIENKRTVILAGVLLAGEELTAREGAGLLIEDGLITDIISRAECASLGDQADLIDLSGRTVLPGLFDCHDHLAMDAGLKGHLGMMDLQESEQIVLAVNGMKKDLMSGVTTARCMGDRYYLDIRMKKLVEKGEVEGPDLLVCGIGMRSANGHGYVGLPHTGPAEFRKTSLENISRGADHLKIFMTPGTPSASPEEAIPCFLSKEEIAAVVSEARDANIKTTAHCIGGLGLNLCISEGINVIDHLYSVTAEQVKALENDFGGWVDMTSGIVLDEEREAFTPPEQNIKMRAARDYSRECINRIYQSGKVRFTLGTDAYHGNLWKEIVYAVEGGASAKEALKAVTVNAAEMTGLSKKKGRIEKGYAADLIAVSGNPFADPKVLSDVSFVMKKGRIVKA